jgi:flagellar protein FlaG
LILNKGEGVIVNTISNNSIADVNSIELNSNERVNKAEQNAQIAESIINEKTAKEVQEAKKSPQITHEQLEVVAQQLQDFVGEMNKSLEFSVHQDSGRDVIKVIDKNNGDLIKQYPTEEVLDLVSKLSDATGSFVNEEV